MSVELPKGLSYNDVAQVYLDSTGISPDALSPEVKATIFRLSSEAINAYHSQLLELSGLTPEQLHANPSWHLGHLEEQAA